MYEVPMLLIGLLIGGCTVAWLWYGTTIPDEKDIRETDEQWYHRKHENFLKSLNKPCREYCYTKNVVASAYIKDTGKREVLIRFTEQ